MKLRWALVLFSVVILSGCSEDFDISGPYQETMAVYGLLNADRAQPYQYIRVSKAFLGEGNVYLMAQQPDSVYYANILQVTMERILNNQVVESFPLTRIDTIPKDSGTFVYPAQVIYVMDRPVDDSTGSVYRLRVKNTQSGLEASSVTRVISRISVDVPSSSAADFATRLPITYRFLPPANATIFDMEIVFRYREVSSSGTTFYREISIPFTEKNLGASMQTPISFQYYRPDFFSAIGPQVSVLSGSEPISYRRCDSLPNGIKPVEYRFYCGTEDLKTYYELTRPSESIAQERPLFTTLQNGVGLFTSRLTHSEFRSFNGNTMAAFDTSVYTRDLHFEF